MSQNKFQDTMEKMNEFATKQIKPVLDLQENMRKQNEEMGKTVSSLIKHEAEKGAQPYITNKHLDDLKKAQTPKWMIWATFILLILTLGIAVWGLLHSYGIV
jgi:hypothetical protein